MPEAGVAHRAAGNNLLVWLARMARRATYLGARWPCSNSGRDDDLAFRFESTLASSR